MKVRHDGSISLSTGKSRKDVNWRNGETTWSEFLRRISATQRTHETVAEYVKATKARQDEIKDVGGFVGGIVAGGRRKAGNITERSLLTLDVDFATPAFWDTFTMMYGCAAAVYSTHKHVPDKPRLRLLIPLSRPVHVDEYEAVARRVAGGTGIDEYDDSTFEPSRLMYWPSTSKDGEFVFEWQDGEWLDPDAVLAEYKDWRDSSGWPVSSRIQNIVCREKKKAEDPTLKDGAVGAFCRAYDIHEAIGAFLPDYYEKCDTGDNRYTYLHGSTVGGLITYEDKWAFSHHGTDPTGGKLCNAFDLVRIHLYGEFDEAAKENTPVNKLPSYKKMEDLAVSDGKIKKQLSRDRMESARNDFGDGLDEVEDESWAEGLEYDRKGTLRPTVENVCLIMENDPDLKSLKPARNLFRQTVDVRGKRPWRDTSTYDGVWCDSDWNYLTAYMEKRWQITSDRIIRMAFNITADNHSYHPVREYLDSLAWDGVKRVETLLPEYLGAPDNLYTRAVMRKALAAAVARVFDPGCKFDYVPVIFGPQGTKKSTFVGKLGGCWASDNFTLSGRGDKRDVEQLMGVWIMEIPEMASVYGKNADIVKSFVSAQRDEVRLAYRSEKGYFPRQCIFIGTTNNHDFLTDATGNRRFWVVEASKQNPVKNVIADPGRESDMDRDKDQIWAEAMEIYKAGEPLYFEDPRIEKLAQELQEWHRESDPWESVIAGYLDKPVPPDGHVADFGEDEDTSGWDLRDRVGVQEIWEGALLSRGPVDSVQAKRIRRIMRSMPGWEEYVTRIGGLQQRAFRREKS